jgi:hypothetical protein
LQDLGWAIIEGQVGRGGAGQAGLLQILELVGWQRQPRQDLSRELDDPIVPIVVLPTAACHAGVDQRAWCAVWNVHPAASQRWLRSSMADLPAPAAVIWNGGSLPLRCTVRSLAAHTTVQRRMVTAQRGRLRSLDGFLRGHAVTGNSSSTGAHRPAARDAPRR